MKTPVSSAGFDCELAPLQRGWDSDYRGRLWIHAASLEPSAEDIARYEEFYTEVYRLDTGDASVRRCRLNTSG